MKKAFLVMGVFALMSGAALNAQVTIGSHNAPTAGAVLDLSQSGDTLGFLPPVVSLESPTSTFPLQGPVAKGMVVYNTTNDIDNSLVPSLYVHNGTLWERLRNENHIIPQWFYMPSFPLVTAFPVDSSNQATFNIDLWEIFSRQFDNTVANNLIISSDPTAPRPLNTVHTKDNLYYYILGFDQNVFQEVGLNGEGILRYILTPESAGNANDSTYMNIAVVVK